MAKSLLVDAHEIKKNCRITVYPDGTIGEILACSMAIFVPDGWEAVNPDKPVDGEHVDRGAGKMTGSRSAGVVPATAAKGRAEGRRSELRR